MTKVTIGGEDVTLPVMNVRTLRLVLPRVEKLKQLAGADPEGDTLDGVDAMIAMSVETLACWLTPPPRGTPEAEAAAIKAATEAMEDRMFATELAALGPTIQSAALAQGLDLGEPAARQGEGEPGEPLTSSLTPSSANSLPPASEAAAGTP